MNHIQMINNNYDIIHNSEVKEKYPLLYKEVINHDKISTNSWYDLSNEVYKEYCQYINNNDIKY